MTFSEEVDSIHNAKGLERNMAPVHATNRKSKEGYAIVEDSTGRVVAHGKTKKNAHIAAWIRNKAHKEKMQREGQD